MKLFEVILTKNEVFKKSKTECNDFFHVLQIVSLATDMTFTEIYLNWDSEIDKEVLKKIDSIILRRLNGEPLQYIAGFGWFWKSKFFVGKGVFIPRPETELVVETVINHFKYRKARIAELGTGSGNIGISVLLENNQIEWHGYENNPQSIPYLNKNIETLLGVESRFMVHVGDFFIKSMNHGLFDAVVSNPPYVAREEYTVLPREIHYEPYIAFDGGYKGFDVIKKLITFSSQILGPKGILVFEISPEQRESVYEMLVQNDFSNINFFKDYSERDRVVKAERKKDGCFYH